MSNTLSKRFDNAAEVAAEEALDEYAAAHKQARREQALMIVGGFKVASRISQAIHSELMRGLEQFQKDRKYEDLGFETFVEFLNSSDSPLSKRRYYDHKALLDKEGDQLFDFYESIGLSQKKRLVLGAGNVQLEADKVIVRDDNGEEVQVSRDDTRQLITLLTAAYDSKLALQKKKENLEKTVVTKENTIRDLYQENDRIRASKRAEAMDDPHSHAIVNLTFNFQNLVAAVEDMSPIEREQFINQDFELIAAHMQDLAAAYGRSDWTKLGHKPAAPGADDLDAILEKALDEDEAALTAAM